MKKVKCCEYETQICIHNTSFLLLFMNRPIKLECLLLAGLSSLVLCNTSANWVNSQVTKKVRYCEY